MRLLRSAAAALSLLALTGATLPGTAWADTVPAPSPAATRTQNHADTLPGQSAAPRHEKPGTATSPSARPLAAGTQLSGTVNITLVTVQTADKTAADTAAINLAAAEGSISTASDYWRSMSNGRLGLSLGKVITGFKSAAHSDFDILDIMTQVKNELGWQENPYQALVLFVPATGLVSYGTTGNMGGGNSLGNATGTVIMPYTSAYTGNAISHEFGHVFGLEHANSLQCDDGSMDAAERNGGYNDPNCFGREYGDSTSVMGVSQPAIPYLNAALFDYGRFGRGDEILDAGVAEGSRSFILKAWADSSQSARAVKFRDPVSGEEYYLQVRLPVGYDTSVAVDGNRGVEILKPSASDPAASLLIPPSTFAFPGWYNPNHAWQAGSSFTTWTGTRINIDWISATGAGVTVVTAHVNNPYGPIAAKFFAVGGAFSGLGQPVSDETSGIRAGGAYQNFQGGSILWSPATGAHVSGGTIRQKWAQTGFENGGLGYPTSDEVGGLRAGGTYQNYENGAIVWSPNTGAHISVGAIRQEWATTGFESGGMGYPTTDEIAGLRGGGTYQNYENGAIVWSPATGAHLTIGAIRTVWGWNGFENGGLGYPTSDEYAIPGGVAQDYQGGIVTAAPGGGVQVVAGAIGAKYATNRALGYATSPSVRIANGGYYQNFQNGSILWTPATGAHISVGGTRQAWQRSGFENGPLGYPTSDEIPVQDGGVYQSYQGGVIYWSPTTAGHYILSSFNVKLAAAGGLATLGYPITDQYTGTDGLAVQDFQNGTISAATDGTLTVTMNTPAPGPTVTASPTASTTTPSPTATASPTAP